MPSGSDWRDVAACRPEPGRPDLTYLFFADPTLNPAAHAQALAVCAGCPARRSCLAAALAEEEALGVAWCEAAYSDCDPISDHMLSATVKGVRGGESERARRKMLRERRRARDDVPAA